MKIEVKSNRHGKRNYRKNIDLQKKRHWRDACKVADVVTSEEPTVTEVKENKLQSFLNNVHALRQAEIYTGPVIPEQVKKIEESVEFIETGGSVTEEADEPDVSTLADSDNSYTYTGDVRETTTTDDEYTQE